MIQKSSILAITTSHPQGSVSLRDSFGKVISRNLPSMQSHAETLHQVIEEMLAEVELSLQEIDLFAVDHGPGSFTGIRVGVATVRAWAFALKRPVYSLDSFSIMQEELHRLPSLGLIEAHSGKVFLKDESGIHLVAKAEAIEIVASKDKSTVVYGEIDFLKNSPKFENQIILSEVCFPKSEFLLKKTMTVSETEWTKDWKFVLPLYIRASAADENRTSKSLTKRS